MQVTSYGISRELEIGFDEAEAKVRENLKEQGFGVLTEIDVKATLEKKLDVDFRRYKILGACNPGFAHKALTAEPEVGLLLPCNVIVYEDDNGKAHVSAIDPVSAMEIVSNDQLKEIAAQVRERLVAVIQGV
ncbi:MAG: hypothetical protein IEMM0002_1165 [bacterium]|nr:MAG: hypothetical protein IEMM0002_1165 [bacterium]